MPQQSIKAIEFHLEKTRDKRLQKGVDLIFMNI